MCLSFSLMHVEDDSLCPYNDIGARSYCVRTQREYSNYTPPHPGSACCPSFFLVHLPPMTSLLKHTALRELLRSQMFWQIPPLPVDWNCKIIFLLKSLNLTVIDRRFNNGVDILHPCGSHWSEVRRAMTFPHATTFTSTSLSHRW